MTSEFDILIIGAGLVGLTTALACAESGAKIALLDRGDIQAGTDPRASALSASSLRLFDKLGVQISVDLQPIQDMLVTDGPPDSPWRLHFESEDTDRSLGAMIENSALKAALIARLKTTAAIRVFAPAKIINVDAGDNQVSLDTEAQTLTAPLLIAADGRNSSLRKQAGITVQRFDYNASSLVTTLSHTAPHDGLAWQRLTKGGALAALPLLGNRSQIVWSGPSAALQAAGKLSDEAFLALLSEKMDGYLGDMTCRVPRQIYPLRLQIADNFTSGRIALVGDAAHVIHPLAGQGLNLGLRDAAALAAGVQSARQTGQDIGIAAVLDYALWRNVDTRAFGALTHALSESSQFRTGPFAHLRRLGLSLTNGSSQAKALLAKQAAGDGKNIPELMKKG